MATIVCIKWGQKYSSDFVNKLYAMVRRNLTIPYRFVCFTEDPQGLNQGIEIFPFEEDILTGWWYKLTLFKKKLYDLEGRILFLDLDLVIVDNIDCFLQTTDKLNIIQEWNSRHPKVFWNSSVFAFEFGTLPHVWSRFIENPQAGMRTPMGDQRWIWTHVDKQDINPWTDGWCQSFKYRCRHGLPDDTKIAVFHGKPDPHEVHDIRFKNKFNNTEWVDKHWVE